MARIVCFGELLVRLSAPPPQLLLQTPHLEVHFGGAEANVAVSLARFGHDARMVSVVPDNALGRASVEEIRRWGVDVRTVRRAPDGRMGLYFLTHGAATRPSEIIYDRADSAFVRAARTPVAWPAALEGADLLHVSGVTPALGQDAADAVLAAVAASRGAGVKVSLDCNYRAKLWTSWNGDGAAIMRRLMAHADILFGDHRDIAMALGQKFEDVDALSRRRRAADAAFAAFPDLQRIASTQRVERTVNDHDLTGFLLSRTDAWSTVTFGVSPIVDRIGAGDAFAAGVLHGLMSGRDEDYAVRFGAAAAVMKHTIPGDFNLATLEDVEAALAGGGLSVRR